MCDAGDSRLQMVAAYRGLADASSTTRSVNAGRVLKRGNGDAPPSPEVAHVGRVYAASPVVARVA